MTTANLIAPYGGKLVNLVVDEKEREELLARAPKLSSIKITMRNLCDLELLATGGFSPLTTFMGKADYERVLHEMRLADGTLWPLPITLTADSKELPTVGEDIVLRNTNNDVIAIMTLDEIYHWDADTEAALAYGSTDPRHPMVSEMQRWGKVCISGPIKVVNLPKYYDFIELRRTPAQVRELLESMGNENVVAFQTRNPLHRIHEELTKRAAAQVKGSLIIHPTVGMTKPGDVDHYTRVRIYKALVENYYDKNSTMLSLLPLAMRMAGPKEALLHAIIRRNHGANHFVVGRDHAGPGKDSTGKPFYGPYDAQELMQKHEQELGMKMVDFKQMVYVADEDKYYPVDEVPQGKQTQDISGTELRDRLARGTEIPNWFSYASVVKELRRSHPARARQGFTVFFTGLSGSGKSTIANVLLSKLLQLGGRPVTILDGDLVRKNLSSELGFSKEHRDINIRRIGYVASEITKHRGICICAPIAPYDNIRKEVRAMVAPHGGFILVHVNTSVEECEKRDRKGLYAKARAGIIKEFTGISDPYDTPADAEIVIDTLKLTAEEAAQEIYLRLEKEGYIGAED